MRRFQLPACTAMLAIVFPTYATDAAALKAAFDTSKKTGKPLLAVVGDNS